MAAALLAGTSVAWITHESAPGAVTDSVSAPVSSVLAPPPDEPTATASASTANRTAARQVPTVTARDARPGAAVGPDVETPTRFGINRLGISMPVRRVGVAGDGQMALPASPAEMGWYEYGPRPGEKAGAAVLAAHRDMPEFGTGPAAELDRVRRGDVITVRSATTTRRYRVAGVTRLEKEALDLGAIFARTGPARLHVVTCSGRFDPETRSYEENLVVVGVPIG